jgi:hypothetical protein
MANTGPVGLSELEKTFVSADKISVSGWANRAYQSAARGTRRYKELKPSSKDEFGPNAEYEAKMNVLANEEPKRIIAEFTDFDGDILFNLDENYEFHFIKDVDEKDRIPKIWEGLSRYMIDNGQDKVINKNALVYTCAALKILMEKCPKELIDSLDKNDKKVLNEATKACRHLFEEE